MATSVTLKPNAIDISGSTSGTTTLQASAVAGTTTLTLPAATDTLVGKATTDTLTNKTLTGAAMNGTLGATTPSTASVTTLTTSSTVTHSGGTANGVAYLDGSKVLTTGSALVFDGTNLGVGTSSPTGGANRVVDVYGSGSSAINFHNATSGTTSTDGGVVGQYGSDLVLYNYESGIIQFGTSNAERMRLDASGNLGLGVTPSAWGGGLSVLQLNVSGSLSSGLSGNGTYVAQNWYYNGGDKFVGNGYALLYEQNKATGVHVWYKSTTNNVSGAGATATLTQAMTLDASGNLSYGSWGLVVQEFSTQMSLGTGDVGLCFVANSGQKRIIPRKPNSIGSASDNLIDLGDSGSRFRTIYAGTGTINTSDGNEKQDIQDLSDAEKRVAVRIKSLIKTFRFKDAVAEKGDAARIHTGVIAQEVRDAFTSEGLDAHRYALFCSDTWVDDETNTEITRLGIRYDELLSFVIAAM